jgi:sugar lactone lactonase YvrE
MLNLVKEANPPMKRFLRIPVALASLTLGVAVLPAPATAGPVTATPGAGAGSAALPTLLALPDGFPPEGIAIGTGPFAYLGNRVNGSIYRVDLRTGLGAVISPATGTPSLGLKIDDRGRLFVAGGTGGDARVVDTRTGAVLAHYVLATGAAFVNDVVLTAHAAYLTDSTNQVLYTLPLGRDGALPGQSAVVRTPLTGAIVYGSDINANGIMPTPDRSALLVVQSNTGLLFRVDPATGVTSRVDVGGLSLIDGDGLLLCGDTLYVVQNVLNVITVLRMNAAGTVGTLVGQVTDPRFDVPTTVAAFGGRLYLPNARFEVTPTPTTTYSVVAVAG